MANTPNLGLHQWAAGDSFLRTDFNSDFSKIDTAVGERCRMVTGTYVGTAQKGEVALYGQAISLPFTPRLVFIHTLEIIPSRCAITQTGHALIPGPVSTPVLEIVENGFRVANVYWGTGFYEPILNEKNRAYYYLALG